MKGKQIDLLSLLQRKDSRDQGRKPGPPRQGSGKKRPPDGKKEEFRWKKGTRTLIFWVFLLLLSISLFQYYSPSTRDVVSIT
ncbi:MAG: hypothetical protein WBF13_05140, partial [Candidatus Zixiibacteriota bacterium]